VCSEVIGIVLTAVGMVTLELQCEKHLVSAHCIHSHLNWSTGK